VAIGVDRVHPFLDYDVEIRCIICSTNAIESLNARYRRASSLSLVVDVDSIGLTEAADTSLLGSASDMGGLVVTICG
jgi:hypothetical protein